MLGNEGHAGQKAEDKSLCYRVTGCMPQICLCVLIRRRFEWGFLELGQYQVRLSSVTKTQLMVCESCSGEPKPALFWLVHISSGGWAGRWHQLWQIKQSRLWVPLLTLIPSAVWEEGAGVVGEVVWQQFISSIIFLLAKKTANRFY